MLSAAPQTSVDPGAGLLVRPALIVITRSKRDGLRHPGPRYRQWYEKVSGLVALASAARGNCVSPSKRVSEVIEDTPMSQSGYADAAPSGAVRGQRRVGSALALRNWRVACRLIVLVAIPAMLSLTLAGLRLADTMRSGEAYGRIGQVAALGQQVTRLVQAMEDERAATGVFIADGRPAAGLATLNRQYVITDRRAATVRRFALRLGGNSARTRSSAATILGDIAKLPGLRRTATQSQAPALTVINGYSTAIGSLFVVQDGGPCLSAAGHPRRGPHRGPLRAWGTDRTNHRRDPASQ